MCVMFPSFLASARQTATRRIPRFPQADSHLGSSKQLARILQVGGQLSGADGRRIAGGGSRNEAERVSTGVKRPALEGKLGLVFEPHPPTPSPVAERGSKIAPEACYPSLNSLGQFSEETPGGEVSSPSPSPQTGPGSEVPSPRRGFRSKSETPTTISAIKPKRRCPYVVVGRMLIWVDRRSDKINPMK